MLRTLPASLLLLGFALTTTPQARAASAEDILARHRAFVGWHDGDGTFKSWRFTTTITAPARVKDGEAAHDVVTARITEVRRRAQYREITVRGEHDLTREQGFTGRVYWDADDNGFVVTHYDEVARRDVSVNAISDESFSSTGATVRPSVKVGDEMTSVVRIVPENGVPVDLYIAENGAFRRIVLDPDKSDERLTMEVDKYLEVQGKKIIGEYHFGTSKTRYTVEKFEPNVEVTDAALHPPAPRATWTFGEQKPIPIQIKHYQGPYGSGGRAVVLQASINGHPGTFLLDSGASTTLLFNPYAETLGLKSISAAGYSGVNGNTVGADSVKVDITVGDNVQHNVIVLKSRGHSIAEVDGILGYNLFADALVDVDLDDLKMTILDHHRFAPTVANGAYAFQVDLATRRAAVRIAIGNNGVEAKPIFDTGASSEVLVSDRLVKSGKIVPLTATITFANGMQTEQRTFTGGVDGTGSELEPCARIAKIQVGPYRYENAPLCFGSARAFGDNGGLIGFDFLRHFNWTFDFPDSKLILTPNSFK